MAQAKKNIPPVAPAPTYGAGGKPYKAPKPGKSLKPDKLPSERSAGSRLKKFVKGGYTKKGS